MDVTVSTIVHKHTNSYLIGVGESFLLYDCGWQDSFPYIKAALRDNGVSFEQLLGVFVSHFHPDHAGTVELLRRHNVRPLILERQLPYIAWLNTFFTDLKNDPNGDYMPFDESSITPLTLKAAEDMLLSAGIEGKVVYTPGHSPDSISLILGDMAFVGDLPPYEDESAETKESWELIRDCGVTMVYPAHSKPYEITTY